MNYKTLLLNPKTDVFTVPSTPRLDKREVKSIMGVLPIKSLGRETTLSSRTETLDKAAAAGRARLRQIDAIRVEGNILALSID